MNERKTALITGITGQDGSYLAELLIKKGYIVHGLIRRSSTENTSKIDHIIEQDINGNLILHYGDLTDSTNIINIINIVKPKEIYNSSRPKDVQHFFDTLRKYY